MPTIAPVGARVPFIKLHNMSDDDDIWLNIEHVVAVVRDEQGPAGVLRLVASVTVPGQGNQSSLFTADVEGDEAEKLMSWLREQQVGTFDATFSQP